MRIWFSGAEVPKHRELLGKCAVDRVAINLAPVVKDRGGGLGDEETLLPFTKVFYSSQTDLEVEAFEPVIERYLDDDSMVVGLDSPLAKERRQFIPEWHGGETDEALELAVEYGALAVTEGVLQVPQLIRPIVLFVHRNPHVRLFTVTSKAKNLATMHPTDVIVSGWISAQKQRELQVWDGTKVSRSPRSSRNAQIEQHRSQIANLGADVDMIRNGDVYENTVLAIKSWLQYEQVAANTRSVMLPGLGDPAPANLAIDLHEGREKRAAEDMALLPVLASVPTTDDPGAAVTLAPSTLRQCDVCSLSTVCPKYRPNSTCGFSIPVTLRTKTDIQNMMSALLELQGQRVLMAKFSEDLLSQGTSAETSAEMDRFFRLLESSKRIVEDRQTLTISASGSNAGGGMLSSLFGSRVGEANRQLPAPVESDDVINDAEIVD